MSDIYSQTAYENRLVAFIDILGFSELIERTAANPGIVPWMMKILDTIKSNETLKDKFDKSLDLRIEFTSFSDCFVLSTRIPEDPVNIALFQVALLCSSMLKAGLFVRGAVVEGKIYHKDNIVFGPGLLDAYNKERNQASYPRIILSESILRKYEQESQVPKFANFIRKWSPLLIRKDYDGQFFLDTMFAVPFSIETADEKEHLILIKIQIEKNLDLHKNDQEILRKYIWLKDLYNELLEEHPEYSLEKI